MIDLLSFTVIELRTQFLTNTFKTKDSNHQQKLQSIQYIQVKTEIHV